MIVKDLIEKLKMMPPDTPVFINDGEYGALLASDATFVQAGGEYAYRRHNHDACVIDQ